MSLTSYRAAPPRDVRRPGSGIGDGRECARRWAGQGSDVFPDPEPRHLVPARPGGDRLSRALRRSTIGAEGFHGRVRDGIGCWPLAIATRPCGDQKTEVRSQKEFWLLAF